MLNIWFVSYLQGKIIGFVFESITLILDISIDVNDLLKYYKLPNVETINNSNKIKWVYLKNNTLGIKSVAFKGYDDPKEIIDLSKVAYDGLNEATGWNQI